ncbi:MAG: hypothetical protein L6R40_003670 [Gallowayella cf. fulva]|nr:MAG: hypothetical protein L6R40_003670 [Xanthomendoza cf. fulva]
MSGQENLDELSNQNDGISHDAKRLRSRDVELGLGNSVEERPSKYITTLQDQAVGTPRRKVVKRRSLRPDRLRRMTASVADPTASDSAETQENEPTVTASMTEVSSTGTQLGVLEEEGAGEVEENPLEPTEGPKSEDGDEALGSPLSNEHVEEDMKSAASLDNFPRQSLHGEVMGAEPHTEESRADDQEGNETEHPAPETGHSGVPPNPLPSNHILLGAESLVWSGVEGRHAEREAEVEDPVPYQEIDVVIEEEKAQTSKAQGQPQRSHGVEHNVPIRTSASPKRSLRRSSRRSSVKEKGAAINGPGNDAEPMSIITEALESKNHGEAMTKEPSSELVQEGSKASSHEDDAQRSSQGFSEEGEGAITHKLTAEKGIADANDETVGNTEDAAALDNGITSKLNQELTDMAVPNPSPRPSDHRAIKIAVDDNSSDSEECGISGQIVDEATAIEQLEAEENVREPSNSLSFEIKPTKFKVLDSESQVMESPPKKTRSGARFSDDTNMLKDFLSRAQARKQAREVTLIARSSATAATSPRRSHRNALAALDSNSPSPHKPCELVNQPGTPPNKATLEEVQKQRDDDATGEGSPVRRSTRKRLPAPAKTATGAPSFIPVRRADGTDPVVLQKSVAQELALVTQTNTRRNKGQSKPPAIILKSLPVETFEEGTKGGHALRNCKVVGWDKKLVYYQDGTERMNSVESKVEENRPKARRLRGLGAGNGTPAPKRKTADVLRTNGTPSSKRQGRRR